MRIVPHGEILPLGNRSSTLPPISTSPASSSPASSWQRSTWKEEAAWISTRGPVQAVVSVPRARLIHLGATDGQRNLLNAPYPLVRPNDRHRWPNQGGHRFWLGPQKRWVWPPLTDWEYSAANFVTLAGEVLTVQQPQNDHAYPALTREYAWESNRLRCTVRWRDDGRPYYGMHVIPVDLPFIGTAGLAKSPEVPLGMVDVQMDGSRTADFLPHPAVAVDSNQATLRGGQKVIKVGFVPQTLTVARTGDWRLSVHPGPTEGSMLDAPDHGYLSQIWVGSTEHDLAELEQLTPFLRGDAAGNCASTIYLEGIPPTS